MGIFYEPCLKLAHGNAPLLFLFFPFSQPPPIALIHIKITAVITADIGTVKNHDAKIDLMTLKSTATIPFANPTPITAPTITCDVETGKPNLEHTSTTSAVLNSAEKPLVGVISVIF